MLKNKNVVLCVTGGIAAYKAVSLASLLKKKGTNVFVVMTKSATKFVRPLTFKTITKNKVTVDMFDESDFIPHISIAELADIVVVAPATANIIAKAAHGIADDMTSTLLLSTRALKLIVPAMNSAMYLNPITKDNIKRAIDYGFNFLTPDSGELACGVEGIGRYPDNERILAKIQNILFYKKTVFDKKRVLVTLGGTIEDIDPVRYIANKSSGRMGFAFAESFIRRGAEVTVICGNADQNVVSSFNVKYPEVDIIKVYSALNMKKEIEEKVSNSDILFMCAAVADYKPEYSLEKIKKNKDIISLSLEKTEDILSGIKKEKNRIYIGFSAETSDLINNAKKKMEEKKIDIIIANEVNGIKSAMGGENAEIKLLNRWNDNVEIFDYKSKKEISESVLDKIDDIIKNNI